MIGSLTSFEAMCSTPANVTNIANVKSQAPLKFTGYCAECGTWDEHDLKCSVCGYGFSGESERDVTDPVDRA